MLSNDTATQEPELAENRQAREVASVLMDRLNLESDETFGGGTEFVQNFSVSTNTSSSTAQRYNPSWRMVLARLLSILGLRIVSLSIHHPDLAVNPVNVR